jgi:hypothetical protein
MGKTTKKGLQVSRQRQKQGEQQAGNGASASWHEQTGRNLEGMFNAYVKDLRENCRATCKSSNAR